MLVKGNTLSPLTNNPDEWMDVTEMSGYKLHQSKRKFSCFSDDGLNTYYDTNDENRELIPLLEWNKQGEN